jgi:hypothetical protein
VRLINHVAVIAYGKTKNVVLISALINSELTSNPLLTYDQHERGLIERYENCLHHLHPAQQFDSSR